MNKINISEPLNITSMTSPEGSIPANIVTRHAQTAPMCTHAHMHTHTHEQTRTHAHAHTQAHVARQAQEHKINE